MTVTLAERDGWEIVLLQEGSLRAEIVPAKGGDLLSLRWLPLDVSLLWTSPWGLRPRSDEPPPRAGSADRFLHRYPGGWQTIFPNGGDEAVEAGRTWGFHGEACMTAWKHEKAGESSVRLWTALRDAPFALERTVALHGDRLLVRETARNLSGEPREAMWSHHPAFGAPLVSGDARLDCGATGFVADDARDVPAGDLEPGAETPWPHARRRDGDLADLRPVPPDGPPLDRFGYLTGFEQGWASITNQTLGLSVRLDWDASVFPCAWYWLEARGTTGSHWFGKAYVLAVEPASTWPGQGIAAARCKGNGPMRFEPGRERTIEIALTVQPLTRP